MNDGQRSYCAALAMPFFETEAKKRQTLGGEAGGKKAGRGRKGSGPIGPKPVEHRAADDAAKALGAI